ncbi:hypothetical protein [Blastococcus saxobsidens]|uniref:Uncharacterized protein n=1 Tax=Blastococcus saxobsidens TaxID=138336 RepID=A0A4Q7Y638_9ACTN|nr:hypothetical protein [Blastococcus saxobsidens]RZU32412.1 hypothetical protein BKA19_2107 [Blastococcus saxobsidens]
MSMSSPFEPHLGQQDEEIPAADPGAGAPPPAPGFGPGGEEPDRAEDTGAAATGGPGDDGEPPFRTPDPHEVRRAGED